MDKIMNMIEEIWAIGIVRFIVYLVVAFVVAGISKWLVMKLLKLVKLDGKFDKWGINEGKVGTSLTFVGKLVYIIVFLLFLPPALNALGITEVSEPITGFVSTFIEYLPSIIASIIVVYVGIFVAKILGQILLVLIKKTKIDSLIKRRDEEKQIIMLSDIIVKIIEAVIILVTIIQALSFLKIDAISKPALTIVNSIFGAIPSIILAVVVISGGILIAKIVCDLLGNILLGMNFDALIKKLLPQIKTSATKAVVNVVKIIIILFVIAQGIEVLKLQILTKIAAAVIAYLPMVIKALVIAFAAFVGASLLENFLSAISSNMAPVAKGAKALIFVLAGFMILSQLGIASVIVNMAFIISFSAVAVAFAIAFGIGGKDFAKKTLEKADEKMNNK